jgi:hypothetical protein
LGQGDAVQRFPEDPVGIVRNGSPAASGFTSHLKARLPISEVPMQDPPPPLP